MQDSPAASELIFAPRTSGPSGASSASMSHCPQCRQAYLAPQWGRAYRCAGCNAVLVHAAEPQKHVYPILRFRMDWRNLAAAALIVGLAGGFWRWQADRAASALAAKARTSQDLAPNLVPMDAPPRMRELLRTKLSIVEGDLALKPTDPRMIHEVARAHLALWFLLKDQEPKAGRQHHERAVILSKQLAATLPVESAHLTYALEHPTRLFWSYFTGALPRNVLLPVGGDSFPILENRPQAMPMVSQAVVATPPSKDGPGRIGTVSGVSAAMTEEMAARTPTSRAEQSLPPLPEVEYHVLLERRLATHPADVVALHELGRWHESRALQVGSQGPDSEQRRHEYRGELTAALRLYERGIGVAKLRVHQAAFYLAGASVAQRLGDRSRQLTYLKEAVKRTPYHLQLWNDLQGASLALGLREENARVRKQLAFWRLPGLVIRQEASGDFSTLYPRKGKR